MAKFSERYGLSSIIEKEITIREGAPKEFREFIQMTFYDLHKRPSDLRAITTRVLKIPPDKNNWTEYPNIEYEVGDHMENCEWYFVYDIIEAIIQKLTPSEEEQFITEINEYFILNGIGWKIVDGQVETRGNDVFETTVQNVMSVLENASLSTARNEIKEAIFDLSRRPMPDITGSIQHSLACLECVMREITGNKKATLGDLVKSFPDVIPSPLDQAVTKIWGFASEQGRHLREGQTPEYIEAELIVEVTSAIASYLGKKIKHKDFLETEEDDDLSDFPF
ncbi:MAG: hypothetical protein FWF09_02315 [Bacteroidales bacterium]|nr:hypothetical protein [Bacteroidales bacterium]